MKIKVLLLTAALTASIFAGCTKTPTPQTQNQNQNQAQNQNTDPKQNNTQQQNTPETKTTASIVNDVAAFEKAISKTGTWIIAPLGDIKDDKALVLEGDFKNGKKDANGNDIIQRKLALYAQDANRNVTARYILTAPSLTIRSPKAAIWYGTFKGDLYVETNDFQLIGATVEGNVYFANEAAKAGFKADEKSKITGKQDIKKK